MVVVMAGPSVRRKHGDATRERRASSELTRSRMARSDERTARGRPGSVDLASGEATTVTPRLGNWWLELADGRLLSSLDLEGDHQEQEIALDDPDTGEYTLLVERTADWAHVEGAGIVCLDLEASEPGIWTMPFPPG